MRIITAHNILKGFYGTCLCWYLILKKSVSKSLKFGLNWQFLYFKPILSAILVTIATGKSNINAKISHLSYSSNKPIRCNWWKATFSFSALEGAKIAP